jgi:hypothetical protein
VNIWCGVARSGIVGPYFFAVATIFKNAVRVS